MRTVRVKASTEYDVLIGRGLLDETGERLKAVACPKKTAVITDDRVNSLYSERVVKSLEASGFEVIKYVFKNGEASKNPQVLFDILEFLAENQVTRSDMVVALGGGVTGDMAGFAAAVYLRGIDFIQIPTTFLAAIDSSVGGKTGVDLKAGKNLAGAFLQPHLVICDYETMDTLSEEFFADGVAEGIKYGVLASEALFEKFAEKKAKDELEDIIYECVSIKRDVVFEDELDKGKRQLLNLGHTFGHAIEKLSNFGITHGHGVAAGMAIAARTAEKLGICDNDTVKKIEACLELNELPTGTDFSAEDIAECAMADKKRRGDMITLILPERIGSCSLYPVNKDEIAGLIGDCLKKESR